MGKKRTKVVGLVPAWLGNEEAEPYYKT